MQNWSNIHRVKFKSTYDGYPIINAEKYKKIEKWIGLNEVLTYKGDKSETGVHFFLDDYQFERVYSQPKKWVDELKQYKAVLTPDFSLYADFPLPIQKYNHFRKHWCGALWQKYGITVYPSIAWSSPDTFSWCFDGEPQNGVIVVSNIGCTKNDDYRSGFMIGYNEMVKRLKPQKILVFGNEMDGLGENIEFIKCGGFHGK